MVEVRPGSGWVELGWGWVGLCQQFLTFWYQYQLFNFTDINNIIDNIRKDLLELAIAKLIQNLIQPQLWKLIYQLICSKNKLLNMHHILAYWERVSVQRFCSESVNHIFLSRKNANFLIESYSGITDGMMDALKVTLF